MTTPRKRDDLEWLAIKTAKRTGLDFVPREERSFASLFDEFDVRGVYVETEDKPIIQTRSGAFFYHENTAGIRTKKVVRPDPLARALDLRPGDKMLDATMGLGCDALVAAFYIGEGSVVGLESSLLITDVVIRGLSDYDYSRPELAEASRRITVVHADYESFLSEQKDSSFDVVYFDPMFDDTLGHSSSMQRLKALANHAPLTQAGLRAARRAARRRIVVKARRGHFGSIEFTSVQPCGNSVIYGIIEL